MKTSLCQQKILKSVPDILLYNPKYTDSYRMFDSKKSRYVGEMIAYPYSTSQNLFLYIKRLHVFPQCKRQGYGEKFINFAKNLSQRFGLDGKLVVVASTLELDPHNPPHIFYRKNKFGSDDKKAIKKIDSHIKKNKQLDYRTTQSLIMYYPSEEEKTPFATKAINYIKNFLHIS